MNPKISFDDKLVKNVKEEINRLKSQLEDLEVYKDELSPEEIDSIKKDSLEQLINNTKILEKMNKGDITTKTDVEETLIVLMLLIL
jgi:hypothetical protein